MMKLKTQVTLPAAGLSGFETPLSEEEAAVQAGLHRFAREVMRPLGAELDKMTAQEVIAPGSPWTAVTDCVPPTPILNVVFPGQTTVQA